MSSQPKQDRDDRPPLPTGLMVALAQNVRAAKDIAALSDRGRTRLIERARHAQTQEEMQQLLLHLSDFF